MTKKYEVTIEQPMIITIEVEAENIDEAINQARDKWNDGTLDIREDADFGTDAQVMAQEVDGVEITEWSDL